MTAGLILLNELFPMDMQFESGEIVDSKKLSKKLNEFAKKNPSMYIKNISKIARLGEKMAFSLGSSVGIDDLVVDKKKVNKLISSIDRKMEKAKTKKEKVDILLNGFNKAVDMSSTISGKDNQLQEQIDGGSRGKPAQLARLAIGPIYSIDSNQVPKPLLIRNSFNTGLTSNEYFNVSSQGRFSSVASANATSEPGALGKDLIASGDTEKIVEDCKTTNGEFMPSNSKRPIGHYTAGKSGVLITTKHLSSHKEKYIQVRTPVTCQAKVGVCQKCYGINASGQVPAIGSEVGIIAGQTVSQLGTQMVLGTKHDIKGKAGSDELTGTKGLSIVINSPSSHEKYMVLSDVSGKVSEIKKEIDGTHTVSIAHKKISIPKGAKIRKKVGDNVMVGEKLSDGTLNSRQVVEQRGTNEGRRALSDNMRNMFKRDIGADIDRKHFDVLTRGQMSVYKDQYGNTFGRGQIKKKYSTPPTTSKVEKGIIGKYIGEDIALYEEGTYITDRVVAKLKDFGVTTIKTQSLKPKYTPVFKSMTSRSSANSSLEQAMNYRGIRQSFLDNVNSTRKQNLVPFGDSSRASFASGVL